MNPLIKVTNWVGEKLGIKKKFLNYPTVTGGFDIFRGLFWEDNWNQSKFLQTYSKSLYVFRCVNKIAVKTASIDLRLFKLKNKAGDKTELFVHDALDILYRPNPFQTKGEFFEKYMINKLLAGEAFILKVRENGPGSKVRELWNLRPDMMTLVIDKNDPKIIKGYKFNLNSQEVVFAPEDIIHDAYPSPLDDFGGISALAPARVRVDTEQFASQYQANFFKNNARPDFILSSDTKIDARQKEEIKERWEKRHKGVDKSGKGAFLEGGLKYQQVSISQREMDYIESMRFTRDDILVAFGVPKPIVAITDDVNLANAETGMQIFLNETIVPEIKRLTEKLNEHFIYPEYGDIYFIEYDESFLPTNERSDAETDAILLTSGVLMINEAREKRGLEPIVGGWSLYKPLGEVPVGGLTQPKPQRRDEEKMKVFRGRSQAYAFLEKKAEVKKILYKALAKDIRNEKAQRSLILPEIRDKYYEIVNKAIDVRTSQFKPKIVDFADDQKKRVLAELRSRENSLDTKAVDGMFDKKKEDKLLAELSLPFINEYVQQAGEDAMNTVNPAEQFEITERIQKYIKERAKELAKAVNATTVDKLARVLAEGIADGEGIAKLTARVEGVYDEFPIYRAETIARTEATAANNRGFIEAYDQSGVANAKEWIATNDGRTRDSHADMDGEIVGLDDEFSGGLKYPGDPSGDPGETINCRCVIGPAFRE